jgi:hypothetical protein
MQAARTFSVHHAADLKGPLQASSKPVLYTHTLCPYAQRVFLALLYKVQTPAILHEEMQQLCIYNRC